MKKLFIILLAVTLIGCSQKVSGVYWCGDHACKNKEERKKYFKKNLVIEIKEFENKKKFLSKKPLKKANKKIFKKRVFKKKKNKLKTAKLDIKNEKAKKVNLKAYLDKHDKFEDIVEIIVTNNKNKPYPDINDFPEGQ